MWHSPGLHPSCDAEALALHHYAALPLLKCQRASLFIPSFTHTSSTVPYWAPGPGPKAPSAKQTVTSDLSRARRHRAGRELEPRQAGGKPSS